jgi:hypothetical protein
MVTDEAPGAAGWWGRALARGHEPVDPAGLAAYRMLLGSVVLAAVVRVWAYGWIEELYLAPAYHFSGGARPPWAARPGRGRGRRASRS